MDIKLSDEEKIKILNSDDLFGIMQRILLRENKIDQNNKELIGQILIYLSILVIALTMVISFIDMYYAIKEKCCSKEEEKTEAKKEEKQIEIVDNSENPQESVISGKTKGKKVLRMINNRG